MIAKFYISVSKF